MTLRQYTARVFGWLLLLLLATSPALAERRVALVIGNDAYTHLPKLNNARKDAELISKCMQGGTPGRGLNHHKPVSQPFAASYILRGLGSERVVKSFS